MRIRCLCRSCVMRGRGGSSRGGWIGGSLGFTAIKIIAKTRNNLSLFRFINSLKFKIFY